jgi:membrane-bound serine protease (ClpP class)
VATGDKGIIGETGTAKTDIGESGTVFVHGEFWNAFSDTPIPAHTRIEVVAVDGMNLKVKSAAKKEVS